MAAELMPDPPQLAGRCTQPRARRRARARHGARPAGRGRPSYAGGEYAEILLLPWLLGCTTPTHPLGIERRRSPSAPWSCMHSTARRLCGVHRSRERPRLENRTRAWCAMPSIIFNSPASWAHTAVAAARAFDSQRGRRPPAARRCRLEAASLASGAACPDGLHGRAPAAVR